MSTAWEDRRGLFQRGKEVHEPGRKMSGSGGVVDAVRRASTSSGNGSLVDKPLSNAPASPTSLSPRRRSSAASGGLFSNLEKQKRGAEGYADRRASHSDQIGETGAVGGWFNSTFRGMMRPEASNPEAKKSVME